MCVCVCWVRKTISFKPNLSGSSYTSISLPTTSAPPVWKMDFILCRWMVLGPCMGGWAPPNRMRVCVWAEFRVRTYTLTHVAASTGASRAFGSRVRQLRKQSSCLVCVCQIFYYLPSILSGRLHAHAMRNPYFIAVYCRINESHSKSHYTLVFFLRVCAWKTDKEHGCSSSSLNILIFLDMNVTDGDCVAYYSNAGLLSGNDF